MAYQHSHQRFTTTSPLSASNTHTLPPALLQALHRLATFSSDIQLLTSHFAPHLSYHTHHSAFPKPTPQRFARRRKPTTRSTAWRLQHFPSPGHITQLPPLNAPLLSSTATLITNPPPRPVSAPPFDPIQHVSEMPRSSSMPPCIARSCTQGKSDGLARYDLSSHSNKPLSQSGIKSRLVTSANTTLDLLITVDSLSTAAVSLASPSDEEAIATDNSKPTTTIDSALDCKSMEPNSNDIINQELVAPALDQVVLELQSTTATDLPSATVLDATHAIAALAPNTVIDPVSTAPNLRDPTSSANLDIGEDHGIAIDSIPTAPDLRDPTPNTENNPVNLILNVIEPVVISDSEPVTNNPLSSAANDANVSNNLISNAIKSKASKSRIETSRDLTYNATNNPVADMLNQQILDSSPKSAPFSNMVNSPIEAIIDIDLLSSTEVNPMPIGAIDCLGDFSQENTTTVNSEPDETTNPVADDQSLTSSAVYVPIVNEPRTPFFKHAATDDLAVEHGANTDQMIDRPITAIDPAPNAVLDPRFEDESSFFDQKAELNVCHSCDCVDLSATYLKMAYPSQVYVSDIHFGAIPDGPQAPSNSSHLANSLTLEINDLASSTTKKKKKKKKKKKTPDHQYSSNHPISLDMDTAPSTTNYDHLVGTVHRLLYCHQMYELLQVDEQGILLGKEPDQDIQNQDVICYSHKGEFKFRRKKDGTIFDHLDVLEY